MVSCSTRMAAMFGACRPARCNLPGLRLIPLTFIKGVCPHGVPSNPLAAMLGECYPCQNLPWFCKVVLKAYCTSCRLFINGQRRAFDSSTVHDYIQYLGSLFEYNHVFWTVYRKLSVMTCKAMYWVITYNSGCSSPSSM